MKYCLLFLLVLFFIAPNVDNNKSISQVFRDGFYDYITCLDEVSSYAYKNIPLVAKLYEIPYKNAYNKIMSDRTFTKHLVVSGETIDDIIKKYNYDISNEDLKYFRKIVYKENINIISDDYNIEAGQYIVVPSQ
ncbi:hypothetical protein [Romboutsia sp. Marseille-P6047]|uniref:hypothetical protein n=1 Tax=Romboutsia sp. Marseille-P6047 TaxID=2161817 RepID=UPI000F06C32B|nr:hypothetical protein [Romboutsia sp. Marseille-P6047]